MTAISASSAALAILQQDSTQIQGTSAADKILSLASGLSDTVAGEAAKAKAAREAKLAEQKERITALDDAPREAGGSVSSEISAGTMSSMGRIAAGTTLAQATGDWEATAAKAQSAMTVLANKIYEYNSKFRLVQAPTRDAFFASVEASRQTKIENGVDESVANGIAAKWNTQEAYENHLIGIDNINRGFISVSRQAERSIENLQLKLRDAFGIQADITYDDAGKAILNGIDIAASSGKTILSFGEDGSITSYNEDGSIRSQMSYRAVLTSF